MTLVKFYAVFLISIIPNLKKASVIQMEADRSRLFSIPRICLQFQ